MNALEQSIYQRLSGGTALTALLAGTTAVYNQQVPRDASYDCVVFGLAGGGDINQTPRRSKEVIYNVKAVSDDNLKTAGLIDAQIDSLLHRSALSVSGWTVIWCARASEYAYVETTAAGRSFYHSGGTYRIILTE